MQHNSLLIDPSILGETPRPARLTPGESTLRVWLFVQLIVIFAVYLGLWVSDMRSTNALRTHGQVVSAKVLSKHEYHGKSTSYYLDYEYIKGAVDISDTDEVSNDVYGQTNVGDPLTITYLPSDQDTYCVGTMTQERADGRMANWSLGAIALVLVFGGIVLGIVRAQRKQLFLLTFGTPTTGIVVNRREVKSKTISCYVDYKFEIQGSAYFKTVNVISYIYDQAVPQSDLTVLYDPQNPSCNLPYFALTSVCLVAPAFNQSRTGR